MEFSQQWREQITTPLADAQAKLSGSSSTEAWAESEALFSSLEEKAKELFASAPDEEGKQPYEGHFRSASAGRLLSTVYRCLQQLRDGSVEKDQARAEIQDNAVKLLNLRADHGRFFDLSLNNHINQVERIYQKLLKK